MKKLLVLACLLIPLATWVDVVCSPARGGLIYHGLVAGGGGGGGGGGPATGMPVNTLQPEISGTDYVVSPATSTILTAREGRWDQSPTSFTYCWHYPLPAGATAPTCIGTGRTITLSPVTDTSLIGKVLEVDVAATNALGTSAPETSHWFGPFGSAAPVQPVPSYETTGNTGPTSLPVSPARFLENGHAVYPGCVIPPADPPNTATTGDPNHVWYFDPVNGSASNNGHAGHPFRDITALFNSVSGYGGSPLFGLGRTIVPGDTIYLEPGWGGSNPVGDIITNGQTYSTSDGTNTGTLVFTWLLPDPAVTTKPVLHRLLFGTGNGGAAGFIVKGLSFEGYRDFTLATAAAGSVSGVLSPTHDIYFEDFNVSQWIGHANDPWLQSHFPTTGGLSNGLIDTASPVQTNGFNENAPTYTATAAAGSNLITLSGAPTIGLYIWSAGYYQSGTNTVVVTSSSGIPNGSKIVAWNASTNQATIAPCDPVADAATGCPTTCYPGLSGTGCNVPQCDPKWTTNFSGNFNSGGGCSGTVAKWSGTTRALSSEKISVTDQMMVLPAGYFNSVDLDGASTNLISFTGTLDTANSADTSNPNLFVGAKCLSAKDNVLRVGANGIAASRTTNSIIYNNKLKWFSGDAIDDYSNHRLYIIHNVASDPPQVWLHQDCIQMASTGAFGSLVKIFSTGIIENECYNYLDATNPFTRTWQGITVTDLAHYGDYVATNIVDAYTGGNGIVLLGHWNVVVNNNVIGATAILDTQRKAPVDTTAIHGMLSNNITNGTQHGRYQTANPCDPVTGDLAVVQTNLTIPFIPATGGAVNYYCNESNLYKGDSNSGVFYINGGIAQISWSVTDWRSNISGVSPIFRQYGPVVGFNWDQQNWSTPRQMPCVSNSFPPTGDATTCSGADGFENARPNNAFTGTSVPVTGTVRFATSLPSGLAVGTNYVAWQAGTYSAGVWQYKNAVCTPTAYPSANGWCLLSSTFNPGPIGLGTDLGAQKPFTDHDGNAWATPPAIGAYEAAQ